MGPCDFGWALMQLKEGAKVARDGWNGRGMWLVICFAPSLPHPETSGMIARPCIVMKDAQGMLVPWLASQTDVLAEDWGTV
ncbi:MAG: DUF2829 domain-containing protein [bacterium]